MMLRLAREGLAERKPAGVQPNAAQFSVGDGQIDVARRGFESVISTLYRAASPVPGRPPPPGGRGWFAADGAGP